ncbi:MAG: hypothetical protein M0011_05035 [Elusimicrobia bacterium]|nr:hypothetical protein [Elusimicrobiota bacterium]
MKPRYQIVISLSEDDNVKLQQLREDGYQIVDIFRLGLTEAEDAVKKAGMARRKEKQDKDKPQQDKLF